MNIGTVIIATGNSHKVEELTALLQNAGIEVRAKPITAFTSTFDVDETGSTFEENAFIKAQAGFEAVEMSVLADDSGLEVEALNGAPGVISARYSGDNATDATNRAKLSAELRALGLSESPAQFRCVLCLRTPTATLFAEGSCKGTVVIDERGSNGFGYDSMFIPDGETKTFGELPSSYKQHTSHRAKAVSHLAQRLLGNAPAQTDGHRTRREQRIRFAINACKGRTNAMQRELSAVAADEDFIDEAYEVALALCVLAGFPVAIDAVRAIASVTSHRSMNHDDRTTDTRGEIGRQAINSVYGDVADRMLRAISNSSPDLATWIEEFAYGTVLGRTYLPVLERELCTIAVLSHMQRESQLYSHVRGALRNGATPLDIEECAGIVEEVDTLENSNRIRRVLISITSRP